MVNFNQPLPAFPNELECLNLLASVEETYRVCERLESLSGKPSTRSMTTNAFWHPGMVFATITTSLVHWYEI